MPCRPVNHFNPRDVANYRRELDEAGAACCVVCGARLPSAPLDLEVRCMGCVRKALGALVRRDAHGVARPFFGGLQ